jgi:hypothetical protein
MNSTDGGWIGAGDRYELTLSSGRIVARRAGGAVLKSVPASLRSHPVNEQLRQLREWLQNHERECAATVERWMVRSLPVATDLIVAVWPDPAWSKALKYAVVWPLDDPAAPDPTRSGFLGAADSERGIGLITLDGETSWLHTRAIAIPHPVLVPDLEEFREFATELSLEQDLLQLHRETWRQQPEANLERNVVHTFGGTRFPQLAQALSRARSSGYSISGGHAVCRIWDPRQTVEARYWIGSGMPTDMTMTGTLEWVGRGGEQVPLCELSAVAYSEGMRMAARIYAGRAPADPSRG